MTKYCDFCNKKLGFMGDGKFDLKDGTICHECLVKNGFLTNTNQRKIIDFLKTQTISDIQNLIQNPKKVEEITYKVAPKNHLFSFKKCGFCMQEIGILDASHKLKDGVICGNCTASKALFSDVDGKLMDDFIRNKTVTDIKDLINNPKELAETKESLTLAKNKKIEAEDKLKIERDKFKKDALKESHFYISTDKRKILIDKTLLSEPRYVDADEIVSYSINEKGHNEHKRHTIARAVTGGIIAGGAGAIIGGTTGGKNNEYIDHLGIIINLTDGSNFEITVLRSKTKSDSFIARGAYSRLNNIISIIDAWKAQTAQPVIKSEADDDIPSQIRKYKNLADEGIITNEEFNLKKKQLLDL